MAEQKKKKEENKGAPAYMTTWGDMCTLLLCFFVLLLAMSTIDPAKFNVAASSFQNAFSGVLESMPTILIHENVLQPRMGGDEQNKKMALQAVMRLREAVKKDNLEDAVKVKATEKGLAIKVRDPVGFDVGSSSVKDKFSDLLYEIASILSKSPKARVRVEGHTDNTPIHTREFPSNWELSAARALNVVKFLYQKGGIDPTRLSAVGYGEYRPLAPNTTPENRSLNRRIEIYVDYIEKKDEPESGSNG